MMVLYGKNIVTKEKCTGHEKVINVCIREDCESEQENIDDFYKQPKHIKKIGMIAGLATALSIGIVAFRKLKK